MTFDEFPLKSELIQAVSEIGFEIATPIQEQVIPFMVEKDGDLIGLAQTGTGKTAAFGLPIIDAVDIDLRYPQAIVLCPTRELCVQITNDLESYGKYVRGLSITAVYGGDSIERQVRALRAGTHIIVATPGRLLDLMSRRAADTSRVRHLVLDEADIMLNMGFKDDMDAILGSVPQERRTLLFSATMSAEVANIASDYMRDPAEISAGARNAGAATVEHGYYVVHARDKYRALKRVLDFHPGVYAIIFCRTRAATQEVCDRLVSDGYNADSLHGDLSQAQRDLVMKKFRERSLELLVATDIAARGLDVEDVTHVIHFDLPDEAEVYTHRSGRTGRAGKTGVSLAIVNMREKHRLRNIERSIGLKISELRIPSGDQVCERQLMHLVDRVKSVSVDREKIGKYLSIIDEKLAGLDRDELLAHFVSLEFNRFLDYYRTEQELEPVREARSPRSDHGSRQREDFVSIAINVGRRDRVFPADVIGIVNRSAGRERVNIGRIDIGQSSTSVQVEARHADRILSGLAGQMIGKRKITARLSGSKDTSFHSRKRRSPGSHRSR